MPYKQNAKQSAKPGLRDSVAKAKIRVLLGLWDLDATKNPVKKGEVIKWVKNSNERSADYDPVLEELVAKGAIAVAGNQISLSDRGLGMLDESLTSAELSLGEGENGPFEFPGSIIGTKVANALLKLMERYKDLPLGFVDASLVILAERYQIKRILTLDRRHFNLIQSEQVKYLEILP